jgi:hypothetical protein
MQPDVPGPLDARPGPVQSSHRSSDVGPNRADVPEVHPVPADVELVPCGAAPDTADHSPDAQPDTVAPSPDAGDEAVDLSRVPGDTAAKVAALLAAAEALCAIDARQLDGAGAVQVDAALTRVISRLAAQDARVLAVVEADGLWAVGGGRSISSWVARRHGVGAHTAQQQVRLARAFRDHLPTTAAAATAGEITVEHAHVLATLAPTTDVRRAVLADHEHPANEAFLVEQARLWGVDEFRRVVRRWAALADPDADDRGYVEASDRECLELSRVGAGYHLAGSLTIEHGQALTAALRAVTPVPAVGDDRTTTQRRAQALGDLARVVLDHGLAGTGKAVRPRIDVLVSYETMRDLVARAAADGTDEPATGLAPGLTPRTVADAARFEDGTPVPRVLLDRLACDGELNRYVFGPASEILDVGRAQRTFTRSLRAAIIARDKHCRFPGCTAPPALCEGHHIAHWSRDHGDTSVDNGILLCWHHHDHVHTRSIAIRRRGSRWVFIDAIGHGLPDACPEDGGEAA